MKRRFITMLLAGFLLSGLVACDQDGVLGPGSGNGDIEAQLTVDPDLTDAIVTDAEAAIDAVQFGARPSVSENQVGPQFSLFGEPDPTAVEEARELLRAARDTFYAAREAWERGDTEEAARLAEVGRTLVAKALVLVFGDEAYDRKKERVRQVISWLEERVDEGESSLLERIRGLCDEAEARYADGDVIGALERLILALQIAEHERADMRRDEIAVHARLAIFMARSAIDLATAYVGDDITEEQARILRHARYALRHAVYAFESGRFRVGFSLAHESVNISLVAVVKEVGPDGDKVAALTELTAREIAAAEQALEGYEGEPFPVRLLEHAKNIQTRALEIAPEYPRRAVHLLWISATMANGVYHIATGSDVPSGGDV